MRSAQETHTNQAPSLASRCLRCREFTRTTRSWWPMAGTWKSHMISLSLSVLKYLMQWKSDLCKRNITTPRKRMNTYRRLFLGVFPAVCLRKHQKGERGHVWGQGGNTWSVVMVTRNHQFNWSASAQHQYACYCHSHVLFRRPINRLTLTAKVHPPPPPNACPAMPSCFPKPSTRSAPSFAQRNCLQSRPLSLTYMSNKFTLLP